MTRNLPYRFPHQLIEHLLEVTFSRFRTKNFFQGGARGVILVIVTWHYDVEVDNLELACLWLQVAFWDFLLLSIE